MTELQSPGRVKSKLDAHSEPVSAVGGTKKPSISLRFRQLFAWFCTSTDSRLSGDARLSPLNTEVARGGSDMKRDVYGGWASAPASVLAPIVRALGTHQHCTCCLVCRQWLHLLSELVFLLRVMITQIAEAASGQQHLVAAGTFLPAYASE